MCLKSCTHPCSFPSLFLWYSFYYINRSQKVGLAIVFLLIVANVFTVWKYIEARGQLKVAQMASQEQSLNIKYVDFTRLFIEKVLKAKGEVSFADRLQLENAVRDLNDAEVLAQWNTFIGSKTEADAQEAVKNLLSLLTQKIRTK